jgi:hypothetical protein
VALASASRFGETARLIQVKARSRRELFGSLLMNVEECDDGY